MNLVIYSISKISVKELLGDEFSYSSCQRKTIKTSFFYIPLPIPPFTDYSDRQTGFYLVGEAGGKLPPKQPSSPPKRIVYTQKS